MSICTSLVFNMLRDVPEETVTAFVVCNGVQPPSWPMTTSLVNGMIHGDPRFLPRDCGKCGNKPRPEEHYVAPLPPNLWVNLHHCRSYR